MILPLVQILSIHLIKNNPILYHILLVIALNFVYDNVKQILGAIYYEPNRNN